MRGSKLSAAGTASSGGRPASATPPQPKCNPAQQMSRTQDSPLSPDRFSLGSMTYSLLRASSALVLSVMLPTAALEPQDPPQQNQQPATPTQLKTREAQQLDSRGRHAEARALFQQL